MPKAPAQRCQVTAIAVHHFHHVTVCHWLLFTWLTSCHKRAHYGRLSPRHLRLRRLSLARLVCHLTSFIFTIDHILHWSSTTTTPLGLARLLSRACRRPKNPCGSSSEARHQVWHHAFSIHISFTAGAEAQFVHAGVQQMPVPCLCRHQARRRHCRLSRLSAL